MRIAVAGGTGTAGKYVVQAGAEAGHDMVVLSRRAGVDILTGQGLAGALEGCSAIVDAANAPNLASAKASAFFTKATGNLHERGRAAGASHLVTLSIVGIDRVLGFGYYQAKLDQESAALAGPLPTTVVRATQFHEFPAQILSYSRLGPVAAVPRMRSQTVAARTVGAVLLDVALAGPSGQRIDLGGPEPHNMVDLARAVIRRRGQHTAVIGIAVPGKGGRAMRSGAILPLEGARLEGPTFEEWLKGDDLFAVSRSR